MSASTFSRARIAFGVVAAVIISVSAASSQTVAPLKQATEADQWLMSTFELVKYSDQKFHQGVDIVGVPFDGITEGDIAVVVADGTICWDESRHWGDDNEEANLLVVDSAAGHIYIYEHLDPENTRPDFDQILEPAGGGGSCSSDICAGTEVSGLSPRDFDVVSKRPHLHFAFGRGTCDVDDQFLDPTSFLDPFVDTQPPVFEEAWLCDDDVETEAAVGVSPLPAWQNCEEIAYWTCPSILGHRDIVVKLEDRHHAPGGSELALGVKKLEWCVASLFNYDCGWNTTFDFELNGLPKDWTTGSGGDVITDALYSFASPYVSSTAEDNGGTDDLWIVATNGDLPSDPDIDPNRENHADLSGVGSIPILRVRATDFDDNPSEVATFFCVFTAPVIRDCAEDYGLMGEIETCTLFTDGPDIAFRIPVELLEPPEIPPPPKPPLPIEFPIAAGTELPVRVCMTARGPAGAALSEPVDVALYVGRTLPGFRNDDGQLEMLDEPVGRGIFNLSELLVRDGRRIDGPWMPGDERCAELTIRSPVRFASARAVEGQILFATVTTESSRLHPSTDVRVDPLKAGRSLARMFEEATASVATGDPTAQRPNVPTD